ncbi:MAG: UMP kinase [Nanoarchaeota archaeon]|nr:UMP kinase [Nanoarchaeota archaeon]
MKIVVSLGGSAFVKNEIDVEFLKELKQLLEKNTNNFCIITGGGKIARYYSEAGRKLGITENEQHTLGRDVTLINAQLLAYHLNTEYYYDSPSNITRKWKKQTIITGGYTPGWNTDVGASMIASITNSTMINITNVPYVYDKDPKLPGAKPIKKMGWERMKQIVGLTFTPGQNSPLHPIAVKTCAENKITLLVMNVKNFKKYLKNEKWEGTIIS